MAKKSGRPQKFNYDSKEFYDEVENLAKQGYSDRTIAHQLIVKFGDTLSPQKFSEYKNEKDESGNLTERASKLSEALARGREVINAAARATYLQMALGQRKLKTVTSQHLRLQDGTLSDDEVITTVESEVAPNMQALATWLFDHDAEWRENTIQNKREESEVAGDDLPTAINVRITYNQKEDINLQDKFEKPGL